MCFIKHISTFQKLFLKFKPMSQKIPGSGKCPTRQTRASTHVKASEGNGQQPVTQQGLVFPCPLLYSSACKILNSSGKQRGENACQYTMEGGVWGVCMIFTAFRFIPNFSWSFGTSLTWTIYGRAEIPFEVSQIIRKLLEGFWEFKNSKTYPPSIWHTHTPMAINFLTAHDRVWLSCSQLRSLTSLTKQSARGGSQRTYEVSWTQEWWVWGQGRSQLATRKLTAGDLWHLPCFTTARLSLRSCCTQMSASSLTANLSQMPAALPPSQEFQCQPSSVPQLVCHSMVQLKHRPHHWY